MSQISCTSGDHLLIESLFGELQQITLVEGLMLEVKGSNGILRMDITEDELRQALPTRAFIGVYEIMCLCSSYQHLSSKPFVATSLSLKDTQLS